MSVFEQFQGHTCKYRLDQFIILMLLISICVLLAISFIVYTKIKPTKNRRYADMSTPPRESRAKANANKRSDSFPLEIRGSRGNIISLRNIRKTHTILDIKKMYAMEYGYKDTNSIQLMLDYKKLDNYKTLKHYNITAHTSMPIIALNVENYFIYNNEWKPMYQECPVCIGYGDINKLAKGYWHHSDGEQCYFVESKPGDAFLIETKQNKIRCKGYKSENHVMKWQYKCANHDYKSIR